MTQIIKFYKNVSEYKLKDKIKRTVTYFTQFLSLYCFAVVQLHKGLSPSQKRSTN